MIGASWRAKAIRTAMFTWSATGFALQRMLSIHGLLLIALGAWWFSDRLFGAKALSLVDLVEAFRTERELLAAAIAAVIGYAALSTWKDQKRVELKIAAGGEILALFELIAATLTEIVIYAEGMLRLRRLIEGGAAAPDVLFKAKMLLGDVPEYVAARERLTKLSQKATALRSNHYILLASSVTTLKLYDSALKRLSLLDSASWLVHPVNAKNESDYLLLIKAASEDVVGRWEECSRTYHHNAFVMHGLIAGVNGTFVRSLFPFTWTMLFDHWRTNRNLSKIAPPDL